ncbi:MAG: HAD domain-containing protein [Cyclobacteriaceae bacterium]
MRNAIILDLDGVLITTPSWKADAIHADGYSDFDRHAVNNFNLLLKEISAELWLSSSRRIGKTMDEFETIFHNRGIDGNLTGFLPGNELGIRRKIEITNFLENESFTNFLIIDDDTSLHGLELEKKKYWIRTEPRRGFDSNKLDEAKEKIKNWV